MTDRPGSVEYVLNLIRGWFADAQDDITKSIVNTAQAIVDIWEIDCDGQWVLWVKTGTTAAGAALKLLIVPTFGEVLENYLQPKPGRLGGRRGRPGDRKRVPHTGGGRLVRYTPGIPDLDAEIASWLPGTDMLDGRKFGVGEHIFWTSIDVADRGLWYWMLIEATETFATEWMSGIMKSERCAFQNEGYCSFSTPVHHSFIANNVWNSKYDLEGLVEHNISVSNNGYIALEPYANQADLMIMITAYFTLHMGDNPGPCILNVGVYVTASDWQGHIIETYEATETITAYRGQSVQQGIDLAASPLDVATLHFSYFTENLNGGPFEELTAWSKVAVAGRNYAFA